LKTINIQGDSGEKVNILGGDAIGHGEIKAYMNVSNYEWSPRYRCLISQIIKSILYGNKERELFS
jgi:hypothetical protein